MAGDVPVWPDNMALMTVKGGCLQPVAVLDSLHCRLTVVILLSFGNGIDKVPADVCLIPVLR